MLTEAFSEFGHRDALCIGGTTYSYQQLDHCSRQIAPMLQGSTIGILPGRTLETYAGLVAAARSGRTYVPLNPDAPDPRLLRQLSLAAVDTLIVDDALAGRAFRLLAKVDRPLTVLLPGPAAAPPDDLGRHRIVRHSEQAPPADEIDRASEAPLYRLFTSGTTGDPKMVPIPRSNVRAYLQSIGSIFAFGPEDRFSHFFNLFFDLSVHDLFVTWTHGGCLCVPRATELLDPVAFASKNRLSVWFSVPSLAGLAMMTRKLKAGSLPDLRAALFCGEALNWTTLEAFQRAGPAASISNLYGPTEATIAITAHHLPRNSFPPADAAGASVPIGEPFPGQEAMITDGDLQPVEDGEIGELLLGGSQLAPGYEGDTAETERRFLDRRFDGRRNTRWYRTGDLVRRAGQGMVFAGRTDSQIKWRGHRIELGEIEAALGEVARAPLSVVMPWPPSGGGGAEKLIGFIGDTTLPAADIRKLLSERLPRHMVPAEIVQLDETADIRNANGKIDRKKIAALHSARSSTVGAASKVSS